MRGLSFIIALVGVIALLTLGVGGAWATTASPAACHDTGGAHEGMAMSGEAPSPAPSSAPAKSGMAMTCCVGCVSPSLPSGLVTIAAAHARPLQPARLDLPPGQSTAPEPGPPRTRF